MKNIDYIDFKKHKLFLAETIAFVVIMAIFIFGGIYSILFPVIDDVRQKKTMTRTILPKSIQPIKLISMKWQNL